MQAQWVCSRERRIALYKRSSIKTPKITGNEDFLLLLKIFIEPNPPPPPPISLLFFISAADFFSSYSWQQLCVSHSCIHTHGDEDADGFFNPHGNDQLWPHHSYLIQQSAFNLTGTLLLGKHKGSRVCSEHGSQGLGREPNKDPKRTCKDQY